MVENRKKKPVVIELDIDADAKTGPAEAEPVPEPDLPAPTGQAMQAATRIAARKPGLLARLFRWALGLLIGAMVSVAFWDFASAMVDRNIWLGRGVVVLVAIVLVGLLAFTLQELAAMLRLQRVDRLKRAYTQAAEGDRAQALMFSNRLQGFLGEKPELRWQSEVLETARSDALDAKDVLLATETVLLAPLDQMARSQIEAAARQVATATAIIPLALADVVVALTANIRMVRRIAEIYGGRAGTFGSWRLMRAVATHLVATGAVAIGDDMISTIAGGGVLSKVSRRFGEGVVNGALTARVGIAAIEVCRPMPFEAQKRPTITGTMKRALTGFFGK
jgi:putative membrane protein